MEHVWWKALQRILDATAFENVGHMRDFEALLDRTESASPDGKKAEAAAAAQPPATDRTSCRP